jgi:two-component system nitrogen regulation sensor histidine kinase NtrY
MSKTGKNEGGSQPPPPQERLLVVEDDDYLREEIVRVLSRRTGYIVDAAGGGEEALKLAAERHYDLLITDVRMPGIDGIELLDRLKTQKPGLASIVITAFADEEATIRALRLGANDYIRKPFSIRDLINAIDRQIAVHRLRREAERTRSFLEAVVRSVGAGVLALDENGTVAAANAGACDILGREEREIIGENARALLDFEGGRAVIELLDKLDRQHGRALEREITLRHSGMPLTYRAGATAIKRSDGRSLGTVLLFNDVSQVVQAEKLRAWKDLARTVAHEIKNPLTPIKLSAQQLLTARDAGPKALESQLDAAVTNIIKNADRLDRLAGEFSRFGRLPEPKMEPLTIEDCLGEAMAAFRETAMQRGVEFLAEFERDLPKVAGDREALLRMAGNLISNALDAMPNGGRLTVAAGARNDGMVELRFTDTGTGIAAEVRDRLFLPYVTSKPGGTGLGLVVVKEVVSQHDGEIDIRSEPESGTEVLIVLPAQKHMSH